MAELNSQQRAAVNAISGPLLVLAGAGSGKTRVITCRIARLIRSGIAPDRILGVTFTNRAAIEMQERVSGLLNFKRRHKSRPVLSTFHSLCVRILRRQIEKLGYPSRFAIYNRGDQESLARSVLRELNVGEEKLSTSQLLYWVGIWKSKLINPAQAADQADDPGQQLAAIGYARYQQSLKNTGAVDFDDLLLLTERLFDQHPDIRGQEAARFTHILVDEYQDTNASQYRIVQQLARDHRNLCVVGDDDQSIYGWRGAELQHILNFRHDWPDAKLIRLEKNYRSSSAILQLANSLIQFNRSRHDKMLRPVRAAGQSPRILQFANETKEAAETIYSIRNRLGQPGRQPRDFAILFRTNEQTRPFETELRKVQLPYVLIGGMSFFDRKEVKDVLAYLRLMAGCPDEISILRIINTPPRGVGKKSVEKLIQQMIDQQLELWEMVSGSAARPRLPSESVAGLNGLAECIRAAQQRANQQSLVESAGWLIKAIGYQREIERIYDDPHERLARWTVVEQIVNTIGEYERSEPQPNLTDFLDRLLLGDEDLDDEKEKQLKKNAIALMTIHSAKGLEFPEVYMVGLEEGILPHHLSLTEDDAGVDEERRLCYVGVTRAQDRLTLSLSLTRMKWGKPHETNPSRFLYELTGKTDHPNYKGIESRTP